MKKLNFYNLGKGLYYKYSCFIGFFIFCALIFLACCSFGYKNFSEDMKILCNTIFTFIIIIGMILLLIIPFLTCIMIGCELFLRGKIYLDIQKENLVTNIFSFSLFFIFNILLIFIKLIVPLFISNYLILNTLSLLIIISAIFVFLFYSGKQKREKIKEIQEIKDYYFEEVSEPIKNSQLVIIPAIIISLLLIHYALSGIVLIEENGISQLNNNYQLTGEGVFAPEQKFIKFYQYTFKK